VNTFLTLKYEGTMYSDAEVIEPDEYHGLIGQIADALYDLGRNDAVVSGRFTELSIHVEDALDGDSAIGKAVQDFLVAVRTALHAAGVATPSWPGSQQPRTRKADGAISLSYDLAPA
jgi:hypothetical protein